jgi:hypothetical protein
MKKLSKAKRDQLILAVLLTALSVAGMWFGLINFQKQSLEGLAKRKNSAKAKLDDVERTIKNADRIETCLVDANKTLADLEENMVSGDLYSWIVTTLRQFKAGYKIDVPGFAQPLTGEMNLLPNFPYRQVSLTVAGTAHFHELGRFLADFENQFPHARILNMDLYPTPVVVPGDTEKLSFKVDIVMLIKPGAA